MLNNTNSQNMVINSGSINQCNNNHLEPQIKNLPNVKSFNINTEEPKTKIENNTKETKEKNMEDEKEEYVKEEINNNNIHDNNHNDDNNSNNNYHNNDVNTNTVLFIDNQISEQEIIKHISENNITEVNINQSQNLFQNILIKISNDIDKFNNTSENNNMFSLILSLCSSNFINENIKIIQELINKTTIITLRDNITLNDGISNELKLNYILKHNQSQPKQRTSEWFQYRRLKIGGSEMHNICKLSNQYINTYISFLLNKIDKKDFCVYPCIFGNTFENEICQYTEQKYNTVIYEMNVINYDKIDGVCYSPDGIGIVNNHIVLFEFKCPVTRVPASTIKYEYQCQINTGLQVLNYCKKCYYCEGEFKKCKLNDLYNYDKFDTRTHNVNLERDFKNLYASYGIMFIYTEKKDTDYSLIDIGELNTYEFKGLMNNIGKKKYNILYFSDLISNQAFDKNIINKYKHMFPYNNTKTLPTSDFINILIDVALNYIKNNNLHAIGYIPWKLYNYNTIESYQVPDFFNEYMLKKIDCTHKLLTEADKHNTIEKKRYHINNNIEFIKSVIE
jgi:hypothetical protein